MSNIGSIVRAASAAAYLSLAACATYIPPPNTSPAQAQADIAGCRERAGINGYEPAVDFAITLLGIAGGNPNIANTSDHKSKVMDTCMVNRGYSKE